ncbi:hypothetical protein CWI85_08320, partial [Streptomyces albidoflavus]
MSPWTTAGWFRSCRAGGSGVDGKRREGARGLRLSPLTAAPGGSAPSARGRRVGGHGDEDGRGTGGHGGRGGCRAAGDRRGA